MEILKLLRAPYNYLSLYYKIYIWLSRDNFYQLTRAGLVKIWNMIIANIKFEPNTYRKLERGSVERDQWA